MAQVHESEKQAAMAATSIMECSALREEVRSQKARADAAMGAATSTSFSSTGLDRQLMEALAMQRQREQVIAG